LSYPGKQVDKAYAFHSIAASSGYNIPTMRTTVLFFLSAALLFTNRVQAQLKQKVTIEHATLFLNGAELYSTAKLSLPQGESEVLFTNVAGNANQQSLTISLDNDVVVQSANFQNNYLQEEVASPVVKSLKDSLERLSERWEVMNNKLAIVNEQLSILTENRKVTGQNTGLSVTELQRMLDLVNSKMETLLTSKRKIQKEQAELKEGMDKINRQIDEERKRGFQPGGQLLVKLYAPKAATTPVRLSYVVPNAGWKPSYDIRVEDLNKPVKLFYKASVFQNSGVSWDNVRLTLSTGNPNESAQAPALVTWRLGYYQPAPNYGYTNQSQQNELAVRLYKAPLETKEIAELAPTQAGIPPRAVDNAGAATTTINQYVAVDNSGVNTSFDIDLPYTIPSDGKEQLVAIKTHDLKASYRHYAVPKLDKDVFLQAQITDWEDLNLLPAPTNIFYEDSYVGQGFIDMRQVKDTMNISLGRDKKVIVRREVNQKMRSVKTFGSNVRESMGFAISVKNTRKEKVYLTLLDQFPVPVEKDITIEDREAADAVIDETEGLVKWSLELEPSALQEKQLSYTLKYPRGKSLANYR